MATIGAKIKGIRTDRGFSQYRFAEELGISAAYLSQLEMGVRKPSRALVQRIADLYGVSLDFLLRDVRTPTVQGVPTEIIEFFRSERVTPAERDELISLFNWWRKERLKRSSRMPRNRKEKY